MCERERLIYVPLKLVASWNVLDIDTSRLVCHVSKPIPSNKVLYSSVGSEIEFDLHNIKEREKELFSNFHTRTLRTHTQMLDSDSPDFESAN